MSWLDDFPGAQHVTLAIPDLNGQPRGKRIAAAHAGKLLDGKAKMPLSALSLDILGQDIDDSPLVFETGDKDGFLKPTDRGPLPMPWLADGAVLLPVSMVQSDGSRFKADPRFALERVVAQFTKRGLTVHAATELEFYLIDDQTPTALAKRLSKGGDILGLQSLEVYDAFLNDLYAGCAALGIPAETATSESGSGQFEVTLSHGPALKTADDTWLFKMMAKGIARKHGMAATFMAKPKAHDAGSGLHVHFSILDANGINIFDDGTAQGSAALAHAIGGCLQTMEAATLIFAPHQNSYLRLVPGAHAPTSICWAYENRTAALRIPDGPGKARRIEHRVAGGDTSPYLLLAAILGGAGMGLDDQTRPPPPITGNAYDQTHPGLAADWGSAISLFEQDNRMARIFPETLIEHLTKTKRQEQALTREMTEDALIKLYIDRV